MQTGDSEPEPDMQVVRGAIRDYSARKPRPADVVLAIEVADCSLHRDRTVKKRIDARARVSQYLIVNLVDCQTEVYSNAAGELDYQNATNFLPGQQVPLVLDGVEVARIDVSEILP